MNTIEGHPERRTYWTAGGRWTVFLIGASSIACLLLHLYEVWPMRRSTPFLFCPALLLLLALAVLDGWRGDGRLAAAVKIGLVGGLIAAVGYDLFRLPFVFAKEWRLDSILPSMDLFKVFPRFGAMILGQPLEQTHFSLAAQTLGWGYHFSNGATFGVMYLALLGNPARRHWTWAVAFALVLELGMLFTSYPGVFRIPVTARFVVVTLLAHSVFGVALGLTARALWRRRFQPVSTIG